MALHPFYVIKLSVSSTGRLLGGIKKICLQTYCVLQNKECTYVNWSWSWSSNLHRVSRAQSVSRLCSIHDRIMNDCEAVGEMTVGRWNKTTHWKPAPLFFCPPQIPHDLIWDRIWVITVRSQCLIAWAVASPVWTVNITWKFKYEQWW
jgi:hypothetical protein